MPHRATLEVRAEDPKRARSLFTTLQVEAGDPLGGASVRLNEGDDPHLFEIEIHADDLVHLRAALNSFLKWLQAADDSIEAAERTGRKDKH